MKRKPKKAKSPLHERLRELRHDADLTQEAFAAMVGVDNTAVCHWEKGARPEIWRLPKIAEVLNTTVEALIEGDERYETIRDALGAAS